MRTSFELKLVASTLSEAKERAIEEIGSFLEIPAETVLDNVNIELKVSYAEAKGLAEITEQMDSEFYVVTVFGSVKQSVTRPFGF